MINIVYLFWVVPDNKQFPIRTQTSQKIKNAIKACEKIILKIFSRNFRRIEINRKSFLRRFKPYHPSLQLYFHGFEKSNGAMIAKLFANFGWSYDC